jgi:hypothetical protein
MRQFIESAVRIFRTHPNSSDDEILDLVVESGVERAMATQLVALLPLAYGRVMLSDSGSAFSNTYICVGEKGKADRKGNLNTLPLWAEAISFAKQDGEPSFPIASRSAEVRAANEALHNGSKLQNLVWSPPVFLWPVDSFAGSGEGSSKQRGWLPAHNGTPAEKVVTVIAILIGLTIFSVVVYYAISLLRASP